MNSDLEECEKEEHPQPQCEQKQNLDQLSGAIYPQFYSCTQCQFTAIVRERKQLTPTLINHVKSCLNIHPYACSNCGIAKIQRSRLISKHIMKTPECSAATVVQPNQ